MKSWTFTLNEVEMAAAECWQQVNAAKIIALHGQMGAGKTTLVQALCKAKKVSSTVSSPTFSIINEYAYPGGIIYHIDLYRLKDEEEAIRTGVEDCLYSGHICLVEWPERAPGLFSEVAMHIYLETVNDTTRQLSIGNK
jgi:tRNA threonylcarbamoyladenosine biosynthesis protein TsaE